MRPVAFGEPLPSGTQVTLVSENKPDRFFPVHVFWRGGMSRSFGTTRAANLPRIELATCYSARVAERTQKGVSRQLFSFW
jgi:hypothetical protein